MDFVEDSDLIFSLPFTHGIFEKIMKYKSKRRKF